MARQRLPDAELELLATLSRLEEATARELREELERFRPMAHGSVLTLLGRLESKSLVTKKKGPSGKAYVYAPTRQARGVVRPVLRNLLDRVFGGSSVDLVASLFDADPPSLDDLDELQSLLDDQRKQSRPSRRGSRG